MTSGLVRMEEEDSLPPFIIPNSGPIRGEEESEVFFRISEAKERMRMID